MRTHAQWLAWHFKELTASSGRKAAVEWLRGYRDQVPKGREAIDQIESHAEGKRPELPSLDCVELELGCRCSGCEAKSKARDAEIAANYRRRR